MPLHKIGMLEMNMNLKKELNMKECKGYFLPPWKRTEGQLTLIPPQCRYPCTKIVKSSEGSNIETHLGVLGNRGIRKPILSMGKTREHGKNKKGTREKGTTVG